MIKNLFKNLLTKAETDSTTKANLAEQNAIIEACGHTSYSTISGTGQFTLNSYRCHKVGNLMFMWAQGNTTSALTNAMTIPLVRIPITVQQLLVGASNVGGSNYPLVNTVTSGGWQYMAEGLASSVTTNTTIYLWAIYLIKEVGGGN